jgi:dihydropteroate synthase
MIYKSLEIESEEALNGSTAMHAFLLSKKASIFRVHDVHEMNEVKKLWELSFC